MSKALPRTAADKKLSIRHLDENIAAGKKKAAEHRALASGPNDPYNMAHARDHEADVKGYQSQRRRVVKVKPKPAPKPAKRRK